MYRRNPSIRFETREIAFRASPVAGEQRSVEAVLSTDAPVEVWSWSRGEVILEALPIDAATLPSQCPLLVDHERSVPSMVGSVSSFRSGAGEVLGRLSFAAGNQTADSVWPLVEGRHLRSVSIGYRVFSYREIRPGETATIAGRTYAAPSDRSIFVAEKWELKEVSLTPIGADPAAQIRSDSTTHFSAKGISHVQTIDIIGRHAGSMSVAQYAAACLKRRNQPVPENDLEITRAAFSGVEGIADLQGLVNAAILTGFQNASDSLAGVYTIQNAPNYLLGELGVLSVHPRLSRIARGGTAPSASFALSATGYRLAKYGCQIVLDERDVEDGRSIGVYQLALAETGAAFRRFTQDLLWAIVLRNPTLGDGTPLFHADRGNLGAVALLDVNLDVGMAAIAGQTSVDENGDPIHVGLTPRYLLVPPATLGAAKRLVRNMQTADSTDLIVRPESRLSAAGVVDPTAADDAPLLQGNDKIWLLAAPAAQAPSIVLAALNGRVEPTIRTFALDQGQWGIGWDISLSVAAAAVDGRPLYWSVGE